MGNLTNVPTLVEHRMIEDSAIGYLTFNLWMLPMLPRIRRGVAELRAAGMQDLVLDLRGNPGGVGAMSIPVGRMLVLEDGSLGTLKLRGSEQTFNITASPDAFKGRVVLLVDEGTASTSEIFAAGMREIGRVTIFGGQASAGAALPSIIEELDGGGLLQHVVGEYHTPGGVALEGTGVVPDVVVPETQATFSAGRDPVLDAAVAHLRQG